MALDNFTAFLVLKDGRIAFETYHRGARRAGREAGLKRRPSTLAAQQTPTVIRQRGSRW
jgi:hypothetical protein